MRKTCTYIVTVIPFFSNFLIFGQLEICVTWKNRVVNPYTKYSSLKKKRYTDSSL